MLKGIGFVLSLMLAPLYIGPGMVVLCSPSHGVIDSPSCESTGRAVTAWYFGMMDSQAGILIEEMR